jgi:hypothetical protein
VGAELWAVCVWACGCCVFGLSSGGWAGQQALSIFSDALGAQLVGLYTRAHMKAW